MVLMILFVASYIILWGGLLFFQNIKAGKREKTTNSKLLDTSKVHCKDKLIKTNLSAKNLKR